MNPISYIRKNGIKRVIDVIYRYKMDRILVKALKPFLSKTPLKNTIIIESHNDFDCNGGPFYDYLIENGYNKKYKIVWFLKNKKPNNLPKNVVCFSLYKPSIRKAYHVCTAKYFLADCVVTEKVRDDQMSIYCTHGAIGLKNVKGLCTVSPTVDYIIAPSENYGPIVFDQLSADPERNKLIYTGYPALDVFYSDIPDEFDKITDKSYSKRVVWMPTFRKGGGFNRNDSAKELPLGIPLVESQQDMDRLNAFLKENDILLVIKLHPMQDPDSYKNLKETENIRVLNGQDVKRLNIDNSRLIKCADALISDYSSIAYNFLLLNRPLGFVLSDLNDYKIGLSVDNPDFYLVGHKIFDFAGFEQFFKDVASGNDIYEKDRIELAKWLYKYQDGNSCKRLAEFMEV